MINRFAALRLRGSHVPIVSIVPFVFYTKRACAVITTVAQVSTFKRRAAKASTLDSYTFTYATVPSHVLGRVLFLVTQFSTVPSETYTTPRVFLRGYLDFAV